MAVTRTITELAGDLRTGDGAVAPTGSVAVVLARIDATAQVLVDTAAPDAPEAIANEAYVRVAGYLFDSDPATGRGSPDALKASGAAALLAPYRSKRGGLIGPGGGAAGPSLEDRVAALEARIQEMEDA